MANSSHIEDALDNQTLLASQAGFIATHYECKRGVDHFPETETHTGICVAAVLQGNYRYQTERSNLLMFPGSLLVGNSGQPYRCSHEHGTGDRSLVFNFDDNWLKEVHLESGAAETSRSGCNRLLPSRRHWRLLAAAAEAVVAPQDADFHELALEFAQVSCCGTEKVVPKSREQKRVINILRILEANLDEIWTLDTLARLAYMSPYHFLRSFQAITGSTPHQYLVGLRLHQAAVKLATSDAAVTEIALLAGFSDLTHFGRSFKNLFGSSPSGFRRIRQGAGLKSAREATPGDCD